jgi:hypothetical protein
MARHLCKLRALAETILVFAGRITGRDFRRRRRLRFLPKGNGGHEDDRREHETHCKAFHGRDSLAQSDDEARRIATNIAKLSDMLHGQL